MKNIEVENSNSNYASDNGILFNKEKKRLIKYPPKKEGNTYNIPDSVTSIGYYSFESCKNLTSITIPNSLEIIDSCAFAGCTSIISINIPISITTIGYNAFYGWTASQTINCEASEKQSNWSGGWNSNCKAQISWNVSI